MIAEAALALLEELYAKSTRASWKRNYWCVYALTDVAYLDIARFVSVSDAEFTTGVHAILPDLIRAIRDLQAQLQAKDDELLAQAALVVELRAEVDALRTDAELGKAVRDFTESEMHWLLMKVNQAMIDAADHIPDDHPSSVWRRALFDKLMRWAALQKSEEVQP